MQKLNKFTAFAGYKFSPLLHKVVYKSMRKKPIEAIELKKASVISHRDLTNIHFVAHRGLSGVNPENTLPSFRAAAEHGGFYGIECDTYLAKDGEWMIVHDPNLDSLYNGEGDVRDYTKDELQSLKMLRGANIGMNLDVKMCTLQDYVDICKKAGCRPVIEIKDDRIETMPSFYEFLKKNDILKSAVIISFIIEDLRALNKIDPELEMWYLVNYLDTKRIQWAVEAGCKGMDFSAVFNACRPDWIKKVLDAGLVAACWTVDDADGLEAMLSAGVTVITTNSILPE